jgi:hypothetical protein
MDAVGSAIVESLISLVVINFGAGVVEDLLRGVHDLEWGRTHRPIFWDAVNLFGVEYHLNAMDESRVAAIPTVAFVSASLIAADGRFLSGGLHIPELDLSAFFSSAHLPALVGCLLEVIQRDRCSRAEARLPSGAARFRRDSSG